MVSGKEFRNRVANTGHALMNERMLSETYDHHLVDRVRGRVAVSIMESSLVHPSSITMFGS
jgi:hypothetical protein